jgi:hypothetical protein
MGRRRGVGGFIAIWIFMSFLVRGVRVVKLLLRVGRLYKLVGGLGILDISSALSVGILLMRGSRLWKRRGMLGVWGVILRGLRISVGGVRRGFWI